MVRPRGCPALEEFIASADWDVKAPQNAAKTLRDATARSPVTLPAAVPERSTYVIMKPEVALMRAIEFEATMSQRGEIALPVELLGEIPTGQQLKVVVMWEAGSVDTAWRAAGRLRFEEAYGAGDDVYEQLINETPGR